MLTDRGAQHDYEKALILEPSDSANLVARGKGFTEIREYQSALLDFNEAIKLNPNSSDAYKFRGVLSAQTGDHHKAIADLNRAIEISPDDADAFFKRSQIFGDLEQTSIAISDLGNAIKRNPINPDYLYHRGLLHYGADEFNSAMKDFDWAIRLKYDSAQIDPRYAKHFVSRGKAHLDSGALDLAEIDVRDAQRILEYNFSSLAWSEYQHKIHSQLADAHELLGGIYTATARQSQADGAYQEGSAFR